MTRGENAHTAHGLLPRTVYLNAWVGTEAISGRSKPKDISLQGGCSSWGEGADDEHGGNIAEHI